MLFKITAREKQWILRHRGQKVLAYTMNGFYKALHNIAKRKGFEEVRAFKNGTRLEVYFKLHDIQDHSNNFEMARDRVMSLVGALNILPVNKRELRWSESSERRKIQMTIRGKNDEVTKLILGVESLVWIQDAPNREPF